MKTVGFIGTGNMGGALARAAAKSEKVSALLLANRSPEKARKLAEEIGGQAVDNRTAAQADVLFLGVKPQNLKEMLDGIRDALASRPEESITISMCAGKTLQELQELLNGRPVIRILPNLPVSAGCGVTLLCASGDVPEEAKAFVKELLAASGLVLELEEKQLEAASGVTGCGPAFAAMFVEALADGAVACGLPRKAALQSAEQMLLGTAQLLLESGEHPAALKDRVCSPAGSTIQGVRLLEKRAFRGAVTDAVIATWEKVF